MKINIRNIVFTTAVLLLNALPISAAPAMRSNSHSSYRDNVIKAVAAIKRLPEGRELFAEVEREGAIRIEAQHFFDSDFEAMWESKNRVIFVNTAVNKSFGQTVTSVLFELHNAKSDANLKKLFAQAQKGMIDKESYVEGVERIEHQNALSTNVLIEKGIAKKIFSEESRWPIFSNFEDHYKIQQLYGHSQWLAEKFDAICPAPRRATYKGTIAGLDKMSIMQKDRLVRHLVEKNMAKREISPPATLPRKV